MEKRKLEKNEEEINSYSYLEPYFINDFGMIKGNSVEFFKPKKQQIILNDIAFVRLINLPKRISIWFLFSALIISSGFYFVESLSSFFIICLQIFIVGRYFTYKRKQFVIQIVLCIAKQIFIPVYDDETSQANKFINKLLFYKQSNPELNILK